MKTFNQGYDQYLILRGYDPKASKFSILKRALIESWGEPGFHQFWRVWNPGIGHLLYRLYVILGGKRIRLVATMAVFVICGFAHDAVVMLIFRRPFIAFTLAFGFFGIIASIHRSLAAFLRQDRWPRALNVISNLACLSLSIYAAVQLQMAIFP